MVQLQERSPSQKRLEEIERWKRREEEQTAWLLQSLPGLEPPLAGVLQEWGPILRLTSRYAADWQQARQPQTRPSGGTELDARTSWLLAQALKQSEEWSRQLAAILERSPAAAQAETAERIRRYIREAKAAVAQQRAAGSDGAARSGGAAGSGDAARQSPAHQEEDIATPYEEAAAATLSYASLEQEASGAHASYADEGPDSLEAAELTGNPGTADEEEALQGEASIAAASDADTDAPATDARPQAGAETGDASGAAARADRKSSRKGEPVVKVGVAERSPRPDSRSGSRTAEAKIGSKSQNKGGGQKNAKNKSRADQQPSNGGADEAAPSPVPIGGHTLPPLPYAYNALEPHIDEQTMRIHHDIHHQSYVDGLNKAEKELEKSRQSGDFDLVKHWERELAFNGAGHYLHTLFWMTMSPLGGGMPPEPLAGQLTRDFGSFEAFQQQFSKAAEKVEGGGWTILVWSPRSGRLEILQAEKHQNLSQWDVIPLLPLDVWEHAYYLKHQNKRADYIQDWWQVVNWPYVNERFIEASRLRWKPY